MKISEITNNNKYTYTTYNTKYNFKKIFAKENGLTVNIQKQLYISAENAIKSVEFI